MINITIIILTYNEEKHIKRCIKSIKGFCKNIIIIDSFSNDDTINIAKQEGALIFQHEFINQAKQFNWALKNVEIKTEWIMKLDADEYLDIKLIKEIEQSLPKIENDILGVNLKRRHIFMDRWIKYGTRYPLEMLRIWRNGTAYSEDKWMDEHIILKTGKTITFKNDFYDHNLNNISWWIEKHNKYASREAIEILKKKYDIINIKNSPLYGGSNNSKLKRIIKEKIYNILPAFTAPLLYFLYRYFIRLGFLDGKEGLVYHFLQGFWYRFLVETKVLTVERCMKKNNISYIKAVQKELLINI